MPTVSPVSDPTDTPLTDRELIAAHVEGDQHAFTELVRRHRDRMWAVALRTLGDREEAADALQDALISAFRNAGSYRGDAAVTTWLHRVVVNACLDRLRRRKARPADALGERDVPERVDEHRRTEARIDVQAALATLPESQRMALILVDLQDYSVSEAAQILGVAEGTVKSRCSRARTALALHLRPPVDGETSANGGNRAEPPHVPTTGADPIRSVTSRSRRITGRDEGRHEATGQEPPVPPHTNLTSGGW
jgi:RNA polymerase sigma-70 factor (ECF subfamily)